MLKTIFSFKIIKTFTFLGLIIFVLGACSSKDEDLFNKSASFWYNKLINDIKTYDLDAADDTFTSLSSEHKKSPLLAPSLLILANAHMDEEEYELANYFYDEYIKRFGMSRNIDYVRFLKIKSKFLAFKSEYRNQELVNEILLDVKNFIKTYKNSDYLLLVQTINTRLQMNKVVFDTEIAALYDRVDKPKAANYYRNKTKNSWIKEEEIEKANTSWFRAIFE